MKDFGFWIGDFGLDGNGSTNPCEQRVYQCKATGPCTSRFGASRDGREKFLSQNPKSKIQNSPGFSLVEVTLAIGIVAFALLAVVALLPVGLQSVKNANEQAGAGNVLNAMADAIRSAESSDGTNFTANFAGQTINYQVGQTSTNEVKWTNLTLQGEEETQATPKRLSAVALIVSPSGRGRAGRATLSVAWSAQANPDWDPDTQTWTRAEGSLTTGIQFLR